MSLLTAAIVWTGLMVAASSVPSPRVPAAPLLHFDKVLHLIEYGVFAWFWGSVLRTSCQPSWRGRVWIVIIVLGVVWGAVDEVYQGWVGRSRDFHDFLADVSGVCLAQLFQEHRARRRGARKVGAA